MYVGDDAVVLVSVTAWPPPSTGWAEGEGEEEEEEEEVLIVGRLWEDMKVREARTRDRLLTVKKSRRKTELVAARQNRGWRKSQLAIVDDQVIRPALRNQQANEGGAKCWTSKKKQ